MKRNKLSHTSTTTYLDCPKKYYLHYKENLRPVQEKSALYFGKCLDNAFNILLLEKDLDKALTTFYKDWTEAPNNLQYSKSDLDEDLLKWKVSYGGESREWQSLYYKGELIIQAYFDKVLPHIKKVIAVQKPVSIKNAEGDEVTGFLDLIVEWEDGRILLMDNKSSSVPYTQDSARESNQLVLYYYLEKDNYKLDAVGFIVLSKKINKNKVKTCKVCAKTSTGREKTCANVDNEMNRCNGEFSISFNPTVDVNFIINDVIEMDEDRCIEIFDSANNGIINENYEPNYKACIGKYGKCQFYNYCKNGLMDGLIKKNK